MTISIGVFGASGRMGRMIIREVVEDADCTLGAVAVREGGPYMDKQLDEIANLPRAALKGAAPVATISPEKLFSACDVAIDFTRPEVSVHHAYVAAALGKALVIGTTGFTPEQEGMLGEAAAHIPLVVAPNMSLGINLLTALAEAAAQTLDARFDIEILEMHHKHKIDAPSGTALLLGNAVAAGRAVALKQKGVFERKGAQGPRRRGDIGFAVLRGGDAVGEHTVMFAGEGERLELTHKASDRRIFATGALHAAKWIVSQPAGRYGMKEVLGF